MSAKFDFNDFLKQSQNVAKMGSMSHVIGMIPGMNKLTPAQIREAEKRLAFVELMINAMTADERERPELLAESRERRIRVAEESGKTEQEVSQLVAQLFQMRAQMHKLMGMVQGQEGMGDLMNICISVSPHVRGLVKEHIASFNYFINKGIKNIVQANNRIEARNDPSIYLRYLDVHLGTPSVQVDYKIEDITPHFCRLSDRMGKGKLRYVAAQDRHENCESDIKFTY
ncbi:uncharacterized protein LOC133887062 isoform X2 [Phragmites australis]|uniref:uncharacterized protein LOC133887062 isoform X2 n=1 Tax=Phragmites australis TaxID=29695 RepID=UPI002D769D92|nr:uncharacterized protein LOC133887062 isoform X2 [Phragmites australis]